MDEVSGVAILYFCKCNLVTRVCYSCDHDILYYSGVSLCLFFRRKAAGHQQKSRLSSNRSLLLLHSVSDCQSVSECGQGGFVGHDCLAWLHYYAAVHMTAPEVRAVISSFMWEEACKNPQPHFICAGNLSCATVRPSCFEGEPTSGSH
jgi:hypothetical protein